MIRPVLNTYILSNSESAYAYLPFGVIKAYLTLLVYSLTPFLVLDVICILAATSSFLLRNVNIK
jgi:hypothetical protein